MVGTPPKGPSSHQGGFGSSRVGTQAGTSPKPPIPSANPTWSPQNHQENLTQRNGVFKPAGTAPIHHFFFALFFCFVLFLISPCWQWCGGGCSPSASGCSCWDFGFFLGTAGICSHNGLIRGIQKDGFCSHVFFQGSSSSSWRLSRCHPAATRPWKCGSNRKG